LAVGYWLLAVGCWLLAISCWLLAAQHRRFWGALVFQQVKEDANSILIWCWNALRSKRCDIVQPIANSQQLIANSQQPIANSQQPIANS